MAGINDCVRARLLTSQRNWVQLQTNFPWCLGLGWNPDVIRVEFGLEESMIINLSETIGAMSFNEVLALMLTFGQQRLVARRMMILVELTGECSLERLFSYLVMAKGDMKGLLALAEVLKIRMHEGIRSNCKQ